MIILNCPSCGANLEIPDDLTTAHCLYCGTAILLTSLLSIEEKKSIKDLKELSKTAVLAENHEAVINYSNKILEIDTNDVEAWINKANSTFWLTTFHHNRYEEAIEYLNKASRIAPNDKRIEKTRLEIKKKQVNWLNHLGMEELENADDIYEIWDDGSSTIEKSDVYKARAESLENYVEAMEFFIEASKYSPTDITILENIGLCANKAHWIKWSDLVIGKINILKKLEAKTVAEKRLPQLKMELEKYQVKYSEINRKSGFITNIKRKRLETEIEELKNEIFRLEELTTYKINES